MKKHGWLWLAGVLGVAAFSYFSSQSEKEDARAELARLQAQKAQLEQQAFLLKSQGLHQQATQYESQALLLSHPIQRLKWKLGI